MVQAARVLRGRTAGTRNVSGVHDVPEILRGAACDPIPVLFLVTCFDRGGAEKMVTRAAAGLPQEKYAVQAAALQGRSQSIAGNLSKLGIPAHDLKMAWKGDALVVPRLARLIRREGIQLLFTLMFHPNVFGRIVGRLCGVPIRVSSERIMGWESPGRRLVNRWTIPLATHVVAVSDRVADYAMREFRIPPEKISTIPNGVDLDHFHPIEWAEKRHHTVIGSTARLHRKNDHATLFRALARVSEHFPETRLLLVGRGPEEARLRALASTLKIALRVHFLGEQEDVAPALGSMDVYVQASIAEGMPNSVLEAMAMRLPIVATAVGGTPEVVVQGETGLLVPPGDPVALAAAIEKLLANPEMAQTFGRAGRERIEQRFAEGVMVRRLEVLLDRLVQQHLGLVFRPAIGWVRC